MKIFPTGKDAGLFYKLLLAGLFIGIFKILKEQYPSLFYVLGFLSIVGGGIYLTRSIFFKYKQKKKNTESI